MQIEKNSRQIPKTKEFTSSKKYYDILYAHLQVLSEWDGDNSHSRIVPKSSINFTKLSEAVGLTRQTVKNKIDKLKELGLVEELADGSFKLIILKEDVAFLAATDTLSVLVSTLNKNAISIYIYLLNRYIANKEQEFTFTYKQLKDYCGISGTTRSNDYIVINILLVLEKLGLIQYEMKGQVDENTGIYKDVLCMKKVSNKIS